MWGLCWLVKWKKVFAWFSMMKKQKSVNHFNNRKKNIFKHFFQSGLQNGQKFNLLLLHYFYIFSAMWVEHSQNAIIGSKLRSIRSPSSSCVAAALESKEIGMEWSKWHTWATLPIFKNFMQWISKLLFPKKYFKKCTSLSH